MAKASNNFECHSTTWSPAVNATNCMNLVCCYANLREICISLSLMQFPLLPEERVLLSQPQLKKKTKKKLKFSTAARGSQPGMCSRRPLTCRRLSPQTAVAACSTLLCFLKVSMRAVRDKAWWEKYEKCVGTKKKKWHDSLAPFSCAHQDFSVSVNISITLHNSANPGTKQLLIFGEGTLNFDRGRLRVLMGCRQES